MKTNKLLDHSLQILFSLVIHKLRYQNTSTLYCMHACKGYIFLIQVGKHRIFLKQHSDMMNGLLWLIKRIRFTKMEELTDLGGFQNIPCQTIHGHLEELDHDWSESRDQIPP